MRRRALDAASHPARGFASGAGYGGHDPSTGSASAGRRQPECGRSALPGGSAEVVLPGALAELPRGGAGTLPAAGRRRERRRASGARRGSGAAARRCRLRLRGDGPAVRRRCSSATAASGLAPSRPACAARGVRRAAGRCGGRVSPHRTCRSSRRVGAGAALPRRLGLLLRRRGGALSAAAAGKRQLGQWREPEQARHERRQPDREQETEGRRGQPHGMSTATPAGDEHRRGILRGLFEGRCWHRVELACRSGRRPRLRLVLIAS